MRIQHAGIIGVELRIELENIGLFRARIHISGRHDEQLHFVNVTRMQQVGTGITLSVSPAWPYIVGIRSPVNLNELIGKDLLLLVDCLALRIGVIFLGSQCQGRTDCVIRSGHGVLQGGHGALVNLLVMSFALIDVAW